MKEIGKNRLENQTFKVNRRVVDIKRFQGIQDQRYRENLSNLHNELNVPKIDGEEMFEKALGEKKELESEKDTIFLKKWD